MSVAFARAFVDGMRYNGVYVDFEPGWETRGNGQTFPNGQPDGELTHHTGAPYGGGYSILVHGRSDLPGPLCSIRRRGAEWARGHYETSTSGKWDPGIGNGRAEWFPMDRFRREMPAALTPNPEDDMPTPQELWDHLLIDRWSGNEMRAGQLLGWIGQHTVASRRAAEANQAAITAMAKLLGQQQGLDAAEIEAAVRRAIEDSLVQVDVTVSDRTEGGAPLA
jgi:hypothetical protein